ncbi:MAG: TonB family protein [Methylophilaceae bacterium]
MQINSHTIFVALLISLALHFAIMRALPWLETVAVRPVITIEAELVLPPLPITEPQPQVEPQAKVKPESVQPKPALPSKADSAQALSKPAKPETRKQKSEALALPILAAEKAMPSDNDYKVADISKTQAASPANVIGITPAPPAVIPAAPSPATINVSKEEASDATWDAETLWREYGRNLHQLAARYKQYPMVAQRRGWEGKVKVVVRFSAEGKVLSLTVKNPGEHQVLDDEAMAMVKKGLNDLPAPGNLRGRAFTLVIPVDFHLAEP